MEQAEALELIKQLRKGLKYPIEKLPWYSVTNKRIVWLPVSETHRRKQKVWKGYRVQSKQLREYMSKFSPRHNPLKKIDMDQTYWLRKRLNEFTKLRAQGKTPLYYASIPYNTDALYY